MSPFPLYFPHLLHFLCPIVSPYVPIDSSSRLDVCRYPLMYASARAGYVVNSLAEVPGKDVQPLLEAIIKRFPPASTPDKVLRLELLYRDLQSLIVISC